MAGIKGKPWRSMRELEGQTIGRWKVIYANGVDGSGHVTFFCVCQCGAIRTISGDSLRRPDGSRSCGCYSREASHKFHLKDLTGRTFGRLTVLGFAEMRGRRACWHCRCACSAFCIVIGTNLLRGQTQSCGCLRGDSNRSRARGSNKP